MQSNQPANKQIEELAAKAMPSLPVWYPLTMNWGLATCSQADLYELMSFYQKNDVVHATIGINARALPAARPAVMTVVNEGAKAFNLQKRGLKKLSSKRLRKLKYQFAQQCLSRKDLGDDQELAEVEDSDFYNALNNPVNDLRFTELLYLIGVNLYVFGIAYAQKQRDITGQVISYKYLPACFVQPQRGEDGTIYAYQYSTVWGDTSAQTRIVKEDMLVFRVPSPVDPHASGDSALYAALEKCRLTGKWLDHQNTILDNRARPDAIFVPKMPEGGSLTKEQIDQAEKDFNDKFRGKGNNRIKIADQAGTIVPLNYAPTDLAPLKFNEELQKALLFVMNIPEAFANNDGNRANLEGSLEQWARQSLSPLVILVETVLNDECAIEFDPDQFVVFENVIPEDEAFELEQNKFELQKWQLGLQFGGINQNDYRTEVLGLEPLSEEELAAAVPEKTPSSEADAETSPPDPASPDATPEAGDQAPEPEQASKSFDLLALNKHVALGEIDQATAISICAYSLGIEETEARNLITKRVKKKKLKNKQLKPIKIPTSAGLAKAITNQMLKQKAHYLGQLDHAAKSLGDIQTKAAGLPSSFTRLDSWDADDQYAYQPYIQVGFETAADNRTKAYTGLGVDEGVFKVVPKEIAKAVDNASLQFAESTNETTENNLNDALSDLREAIENSAIEGDPITNLRKNVETIFENIEKDRAEMIARTEMSRAVHESQKIVAKASGVVKGFVLKADPDCCDYCADLDGTSIGLDGSFAKDDYSTTPCPLHPNCRCQMLEDIDLDSL